MKTCKRCGQPIKPKERYFRPPSGGYAHRDGCTTGMPTGIAMIERERNRQIEQEGWSAKHDDSHKNAELLWAAICYAREIAYRAVAEQFYQPVPEEWPWDGYWWKPSTDTIRQLSKAGALIAAEIDRLQRRINK